ncbi:hypothetical protein [Thioalkalivibrio sp.]|uniref:DUF7931 domain-containing protein n=1 Tax=Thioalkalivibrio sp. TaxID=2093813 RepID=UPI00356A959C
MNERTDDDIPEDDLQRAGAAIDRLLESARRRIWVHARCRLLMALPETRLREALSRVARRTRHPDLRLLVDDDLELKSGLPRLAATAMRLPTAISVRCLAPAQDTPASLLLIVDREAWLYLVQHKGRAGLRVESRDPAGNRRAAEDFEQNWAAGSESRELRKLSL